MADVTSASASASGRTHHHQEEEEEDNDRDVDGSLISRPRSDRASGRRQVQSAGTTPSTNVAGSSQPTPVTIRQDSAAATTTTTTTTTSATTAAVAVANDGSDEPPAGASNPRAGSTELPSDSPPPYSTGSYPGVLANMALPPYPGLPRASAGAPRLEPSSRLISDRSAAVRHEIRQISSDGPASSQWLTSLLVCMFCFCWPISTIAIYYSFKTSEANSMNDYHSAALYANSARRLNFVALSAGALFITSILALLIFFGLRAFSVY